MKAQQRMPRRAHRATDEIKRQVEGLASKGVPQQSIGALVGVSVPVLHREYRVELDRGMARANAVVMGHLFAHTKTNASAAIFWAKCRCDFREVAQVEVSGPQGGPVQIDVVSAVGALMAKLAADKAMTAIEGTAE
ncbi:hypothetical protein E2C06_30525 [Dankookia rubra]|uniref:Uncharacterized protein n=1 Tax=Dankookia rubra TaxID=1442381 RepID=A0A4R5Q7V4_9PROT|nr:hypothetical protein [Dankookia rubra]TDH58806.1 hypothetical protein E2C06_30525 [Dankookia rubra]